jgi:hypothetical protein
MPAPGSAIRALPPIRRVTQRRQWRRFDLLPAACDMRCGSCMRRATNGLPTVTLLRPWRASGHGMGCSEFPRGNSREGRARASGAGRVQCDGHRLWLQRLSAPGARRAAGGGRRAAGGAITPRLRGVHVSASPSAATQFPRGNRRARPGMKPALVRQQQSGAAAGRIQPVAQACRKHPHAAGHRPGAGFPRGNRPFHPPWGTEDRTPDWTAAARCQAHTWIREPSNDSS